MLVRDTMSVPDGNLYSNPHPNACWSLATLKRPSAICVDYSTQYPRDGKRFFHAVGFFSRRAILERRRNRRQMETVATSVARRTVKRMTRMGSEQPIRTACAALTRRRRAQQLAQSHASRRGRWPHDDVETVGGDECATAQAQPSDGFGIDARRIRQGNAQS